MKLKELYKRTFVRCFTICWAIMLLICGLIYFAVKETGYQFWLGVFLSLVWSAILVYCVYRWCTKGMSNNMKGDNTVE